MFLIQTTTLCLFLRILYAFNDSTTSRFPCPVFHSIPNGIVKVIDNGFEEIATITCEDGYDLEGASAVYCMGGQWEGYIPPNCIKKCNSPPYIRNGILEVDSSKDENGMYRKGTLATYSCKEGYYLSPAGSQYRVCEKGIWTGPYSTCIAVIKVSTCPTPKDVANGYFVPEKPGLYQGFIIGQRLHYSCKSGYNLVGSSVQQCLEDGSWSPKIPPVCAPLISTATESSCPALPYVPHTYTTISQGFQSAEFATSGTIVLIHCINKYKNTKSPCQPEKLRCVEGVWVGTLPECVLVHECEPPPTVLNAAIYNLSPASFEPTLAKYKYPIKSQISYQCFPGYSLQGNGILTCSSGGCWTPDDVIPICYRPSNNYFLEVNSINAILISAATGAGVLGILLIICLITVYKRKKPLSRAAPIAPPVPRSSLGDHATLLHHPDRLALIAFADGLQNDQSALPTYDEATRDRPPLLTTNRLHRPNWPNLGGRRPRNTPNPDVVHVTRHGSFASHTPSTRSAGDSMGSTDTVAISEGSTNVTLDTVSSHSGSQPASCRAHCGSLASFDTSSVINTEGVPLLEESELEEIHCGDNVSLIVENHSISDNASFKLSVASADIS